MAEKIRVRVFVDFWNFQLGWNRFHSGIDPLPRIPWKDTLVETLVREAIKDGPGKFAGINVYASIDPKSRCDKKLNNWLHHVLASYKGYSVLVKDRKPRNPPHCSNDECRFEIAECPKCQEKLRSTVEKGIDASIITELIAGAFDATYETAVLISGDADFSPAVRYIQNKTNSQIVQAFFRNRGDELRNACWDHVFLEDLMPKLIGAEPAAGET